MLAILPDRSAHWLPAGRLRVVGRGVKWPYHHRRTLRGSWKLRLRTQSPREHATACASGRWLPSTWRSLVDAARKERAVHDQDLAVHEARALGRQEHGRSGQLFDPTDPLHRSPQHTLVTARRAVEQRRVQLGSKEAGGQSVDADALRPPFDGERLGERGDGCLAGAVRCDLVKGDERSHRGDVDDPPIPAFEHVPAEHLTAAQRAGQIRLENGRPLALAEVERWGAFYLPGAVHQDVDLPERRHDGREQAFEGGPVGHVGRDAERPATEAFQLVCGLLDGLEGPPGRDDICTGFGQGQAESAPKPGGSPEDDGHATVKIEKRAGHGLPPRQGEHSALFIASMQQARSTFDTRAIERSTEYGPEVSERRSVNTT